MIVWFDMDGVLADFDGHYMKLTGRPTWYGDAEKTHDEKWNLIMQHPTFFKDLPWVPGARMMYAFVEYSKKATAAILSAASGHIKESAEHKYIWLANEIPTLFDPNAGLELVPRIEGTVQIVAHKRDKAAFAKPGDILVDDFDANIDAWRKAGGIGIRFRDAIQAITELQEHMQTPDKYFKIALACAKHNVASPIYLAMHNEGKEQIVVNNETGEIL